MIKKLSQRRTGFSPPGLLSINCVQSHVSEDAKSCEEECGRRDIFCEGIVVSKHVGIGKNN